MLVACLVLIAASATCAEEKDSKIEKRGLGEPGTLGGYGLGGQLSFRGANYGPGFDWQGPIPNAPVHIGTNIHTTVTKQFAVPVPHPVPVPVERRVHVPHPVPVPVAVPRPYPVFVPKPYAVPVDRPYPVPVDRPYGVPVPHPVPYHVPEPYPVGIARPFGIGVPPPQYASGYGPGLGFAPYPVRPYIRNEGVGLGIGSAIVH